MNALKFISHRKQADAMTKEAIKTVLELCGQVAETHTIANAPKDKCKEYKEIKCLLNNIRISGILL